MQVCPKPASSEALLADIASWIKTNFPGGESGIIYVLTRKVGASWLVLLRCIPSGWVLGGCLRWAPSP